jgi:D-alanyl-D-alanine carboxypeptidase
MKKFLITGMAVFAFTSCFSQAFNNKRVDSLFSLMQADDKFMGSIAVSQNGRLIYSNSIGYANVETGKTADNATIYRIGSISKMFTATLILEAVEEKKIKLTQTLDKYFGQIENSQLITIEDLLSHKSGIHDFTTGKNFLAYHTQSKTESEMVAIIAAAKSDFKPKSRVEYSNPNYILLSYILEKVYKQSYAAVLNAKIIKPLGLKNTSFGNPSQGTECCSYHFTDKWEKAADTHPSIPMGAGAIISTPADLNVFMEQLFKGKVISQKSVALMTATTDFHGLGIGVGMLEFKNFGHKCYGHNGSIDDFKSLLCYFPDEKLSIALISNGTVYSIENVLSCAVSSFYNQPFKMPDFGTFLVDPKILDLYQGKYFNQQAQLKIAVTIKENKLFAQVSGQNAFPLDAVSVNIFKFEQAGVELEFDEVKKQMTLRQGGHELLFSKE